MTTAVTRALRCPFIGAKVLNNVLESPAADVMVKTCPYLGRVCHGGKSPANKPCGQVKPHITMDVSARFMDKCPFSKVMGDNLATFIKSPGSESDVPSEDACELLSANHPAFEVFN